MSVLFALGLIVLTAIIIAAILFIFSVKAPRVSKLKLYGTAGLIQMLIAFSVFYPTSRWVQTIDPSTFKDRENINLEHFFIEPLAPIPEGSLEYYYHRGWGTKIKIDYPPRVSVKDDFKVNFLAEKYKVQSGDAKDEHFPPGSYHAELKGPPHFDIRPIVDNIELEKPGKIEFVWVITPKEPTTKAILSLFPKSFVLAPFIKLQESASDLPLLFRHSSKVPILTKDGTKVEWRGKRKFFIAGESEGKVGDVEINFNKGFLTFPIEVINPLGFSEGTYMLITILMSFVTAIITVLLGWLLSKLDRKPGRTPSSP